MNLKLKYLALAAAVIFSSYSQNKPSTDNEDGLAAFSADSMRLHVSQLNDDSLMGRKPFTEGETKMIVYLQKQFKQAGLEPGNGDSYIQEVPMVNIQNVIGKITGSKRPDEVIIYTSHWDHLGIGKPDETGDSIYNGALDNTTGTAGLIELARAFKSLKTLPERTIVILAVTAEEQGLWGSAYYAQNPVYPVSKAVANINIDGLNPVEKTRDIIIVGKWQSELENYLKEALLKRRAEAWHSKTIPKQVIITALTISISPKLGSLHYTLHGVLT